MYSNLDPAVNGSMPAVRFVVAGEDRTKRQKDLAEAAQKRAERRVKLLSALGKAYLPSDLRQMISHFYPGVFSRLGRTYRTTPEKERAYCVFLYDLLAGRNACRRSKGFMRVHGLGYLSPLFDEPNPKDALAWLRERLAEDGLELEVQDYVEPFFDQRGWCRSVRIKWNEAVTDEIKLFRAALRRGVVDQPVRIDSPTGKPRKALPKTAIRDLKKHIDEQIAACKNPKKKARMVAFREQPSFKREIQPRAQAAIAAARVEGDYKSAAAIAKVAEVGRSWVGGRPDSDSSRVGGLSSPGSLKRKHREALFPDAVELDMVACNLHNAAMIGDAPQARELLQGWAKQGLDPHMMVASESLEAIGVSVETQLKRPEMLAAARERVKKITTPLLGGAKPGQHEPRPLEYAVGNVKNRLEGFAEQVLRHPVAEVPRSLFGPDGMGGLAAELRRAGRVTAANGQVLQMRLDPQDSPEDREKRARHVIYCALDNLEGAGIVAGLEFMRRCGRGRLRPLYDLSDGLGVRRVGRNRDKLHLDLVEDLRAAIEEGVRAEGGFGRCRVAFDPLRGGKQVDEKTPAFLQRRAEADKERKMSSLISPPIRCTREAEIAKLPSQSLALRAPLTIVVEEWAEDGMRTARLPGLPLHSDSHISDEDAVAKLGEEIVALHGKLSDLTRKGKLCGVLIDEWKILSAAVEVVA